MENEVDEKFKIKAVDLNTESLKLYIAICVASIAGIIAYHNSPNILHSEVWFYVAIASLISCAILSLFTLNSFISPMFDGKVDVHDKLSLRLNFAAIILFAVALFSVAGYFIFSQKKPVELPKAVSNGIVIQGNNISIGEDVKTKIIIKKDSIGNIKEIRID
ncbi:MAG: hypothetical protein EOP00_25700 [Pedobacter sp.]|nr:MAG: hypothetical protein EOP00_25700 [Pedobacter sp.]